MFSTTIANEIANYMRRGVAMTVFGSLPATMYLALYTTTIDASDSATEVPINGNTNYARLAVTRGSGESTAAAAGVTANTGILQFNTPNTVNWGTIRAFAWRTAATGGTMIDGNNLVTPIIVNVGDTGPKFNVGANILEVD